MHACTRLETPHPTLHAALHAGRWSLQASSALSVAASLDCSLTNRDISLAVQRITINTAMPCERAREREAHACMHAGSSAGVQARSVAAAPIGTLRRHIHSWPPLRCCGERRSTSSCVDGWMAWAGGDSKLLCPSLPPCMQSSSPCWRSLCGCCSSCATAKRPRRRASCCTGATARRVREDGGGGASLCAGSQPHVLLPRTSRAANNVTAHGTRKAGLIRLWDINAEHDAAPPLRYMHQWECRGRTSQARTECMHVTLALLPHQRTAPTDRHSCTCMGQREEAGFF